MTHPSAQDAVDVLFLCTGNICRSPMAEVLLRHRLKQRGVPARVHSAGLLDDGRPASGPGISVMADRGLDLTGHRSRRMTAAWLTDADLVLGMARGHVREAAALVPECWPRAFTLKELVRRAADLGQREPVEPLDEWLARVHAGRSRAELLGEHSADDVADPIGLPRSVYEVTAAELESLIDRLTDLAFPANARVQGAAR